VPAVVDGRRRESVVGTRNRDRGSSAQCEKLLYRSVELQHAPGAFTAAGRFSYETNRNAVA
jgi:hypothetical protein